MPKKFAIAVYIAMIAFFAAFFAWPIWQVMEGGFRDPDGKLTTDYFKEVFANPIYVEGLTNAFLSASYTTILCILISVPLAYIYDRFKFPGKTLFGALILMPIMLPPFVGAIGVQQILGQYGVLNVILDNLGFIQNGHYYDWLGGEGRLWGVVILQSLGLYPILYLNTQASLANIDPAMEEAAQNLGCKGIKRFFKITLPLIRPGLFAGCTIIFIWSFTELGVPLIFDFDRITAVQIFSGLKDIGGNPFPYALVTVMLLFSIAFYAIGKGLFGRQSFAMMAKASHASDPITPGLLGKFICTGLFGGILLLALLPHMAVILISFSADWYNSILPQHWTFQNYEIALGHKLTVLSIKNSLTYAAGATCLNVLLGICVAFVIVRTKLPGRGLLDTMAMLPLAVPGLVMAFGYLAMSQDGKFFDFLNPVNNPTALLIIAYAVRKLPFVVRSAVAGLQQTSETYEEAAQNLGCPPLKSSMRITLPLIMANLLAGALLAFSQSMLEVSDSMILAFKENHFPITKAIYELMSLLGDGRFIASALGVWSMAFLAVTIIGASILLGKKMGAIFRV